MVLAYAASTPELVPLGALSVLLPLSAAVFVRFRRIALEVTRSFDPEVVAVGADCVVELSIANAAAFPTPLLEWRDRLPWEGSPRVGGTAGPLAARRGRVVQPASAAVVRYRLLPRKRGIVDIGPMTVELGDPFGLAVGQVPVGGVDQLVVTPALTALAETGLGIVVSEGTTMLVTKAVGGEDDLSTREYRRGDALRRVHWRATARHGELMVRQEEPRSHSEARVVLDTREGGYRDADPVSRSQHAESAAFELALSLAASISLHLARSGIKVDFVETGRRQLEEVAPLPPFLRTLATIRLTRESGEHSRDSHFAASTRPDHDRGSVFAVLADADPHTVERLIAQRSSFTLAIAFVVAGRGSPVPEQLRLAGWTTVVVPPGASADGAWRAVGELHGAGSGR